MHRPARAVFAGLARNCAPTLPAVLANIEAMAGAFQDSAFLFLENDSADGTRALLERWCAGRPQAALLSPAGPEGWHPVRTIRLAALRNQVVETLRARYADYDVAVLMDCDEVNAAPKDIAAFARALEFLWADQARAAVFANTLGAYYDMWALRHPQRCPDDIWEAMMDYTVRHNASDEAAFQAVYAPRLFALSLGDPPLEVDSAFGGLGIYRLSRMLANRARYQGYKLRPVPTAGGLKEMGWQCCEHVSFHAGLRAAGGRLFVLPWLSSGRLNELVVSRDFWRFIPFDPALLDAANAGTPASPSRNQPCPCGSGRRYKHCHGAATAA